LRRRGEADFLLGAGVAEQDAALARQFLLDLGLDPSDLLMESGCGIGFCREN